MPVNANTPITQNINVVFIFDGSGSLRQDNAYQAELQAIQATIDALREEFIVGLGQIDVKLIQFSAPVSGTRSGFKETNTFDLFAPELNNIAVLPETIQIGGETNYDPPLQAALDFLTSPEQSGEENFVFFASDGQPFGDPRYPTNFQETALELQAVADVQAFGFGLGANTPEAIQALNEVDSDDAIIAATVEELADAFRTSPLFEVAMQGNANPPFPPDLPTDPFDPPGQNQPPTPGEEPPGSDPVPPGQVPVAVDDALSTNEDSLQIGMGFNWDFETLLNDNGFGADSDPNDDPLTVTAVAGSALNVNSPILVQSEGDRLAWLTVQANGTVTLYDPDANFNNLGQDATDTIQFSYTISDGLFSDTATATLTIQGVDDPPEIGGQFTGHVTEDTNPPWSRVLRTSGTLTIDDPDDGDVPAFAPQTTVSDIGTFNLLEDGRWFYSAVNSQSEIQALGLGKTLDDTFEVFSQDGLASEFVTVTVHGRNDRPTIAGVNTGTVTEDAGATLTTIGQLTIDDPDTGESFFQAGTFAGAFGAFGLTSTGQWTYAATNSQESIQSIPGWDTRTDSFDAVSLDGSATRTVFVTINGVNDVPSLGGNTTRFVFEDDADTLTTSGRLAIDDADANESEYQPVTLPGFMLAASGAWTFSISNAAVQFLPEGATTSYVFTATSEDGTATISQRVVIVGRNDLPTISGDLTVTLTEDGRTVGPTYIQTLGQLDIVDPDLNESSFQRTAGDTTFGGYYVREDGLYEYFAENNQAAIQNLAAGETLTDSFTAVALDGSTKEITVTIHGLDDPRLDLFMTTPESHSSATRHGTADGTFGSGSGLEGHLGRDVALGDIDNDGDLDAIVANGRIGGVGTIEARTQVFFNTPFSDGSFGNFIQDLTSDPAIQLFRPTTNEFDPWKNSSVVALADFNNDGLLDIYLANRGPDSGGGEKNQVLMNVGGPADAVKFVAGPGTGDGGAQITTDVAIGDLDNDGDNDVFLTNLNEKNKVLINKGLATADFDVGPDPENSPTGKNLSRGVDLGDVDNDGDLDAFIVEDNGLQLLINQGLLQGGALADFDEAWHTSFASGHDVELGDLDGDGDLDAFVLYNSGFDVWSNQGANFVRTEIKSGLANPADAALADLDGDGDLDAVITLNGSGGTRDVYINQGIAQDGVPGQFELLDSQSTGVGDTLAIALGDFTGDGDFDQANANGLPNLDPLGIGYLPDTIV